MGDSRKEIEAFYGKLAALTQKEDLRGVKALVLESATFTMSGRGPMNKTRWAEGLARAFQGTASVSSRYTLESLRVRGTSASVRLSQVSRTTYKDPQGKSHTLETRRRLDDTLTRGPRGGWLLADSKITLLEQKIDGKRVITR